MHDLITTFTLILLTVLAGVASVLSVLRWSAPAPRAATLAALGNYLTGFIALASFLLFLNRTLFVSSRWAPLEAHVDGLLLLSTLIALFLLWIRSHWRVPGVSAFALPTLTLLLAWGICASAWTFQPFQISSVWTFVHLVGVYTGTLFFVVAAGAGALFLRIDHLLRLKNPSHPTHRLGNLEATERLMIRSAALGFALLTLGLVTGVIIILSGSSLLGPDWWRSPKVLLGCLAWASYGLLMNVRHTTLFRGRRAAILSIAGLLLLLATLALAVSLPSHAPATSVHPTEAR